MDKHTMIRRALFELGELPHRKAPGSRLVEKAARLAFRRIMGGAKCDCPPGYLMDVIKMVTKPGLPANKRWKRFGCRL